MAEITLIVLGAVCFVLILGRLTRQEPGPTKSSLKPRPVACRSRSKGTPPAGPWSRELIGKCYVIDGDTIVIKGKKIRLAGIDAPELCEPFGQKSKWAMVNICKGQIVTAKLNGETSYDRVVARAICLMAAISGRN